MTNNNNQFLLMTMSAVAGGIMYWMFQRMAPKKKYLIPPELLRTKYSSELAIAVSLALKAGKNMIQHCDTKGSALQLSEKDLGIITKGQAEDFATIIDIENETMISDTIRRMFPTHEIIGEETVGSDNIPILTKSPTWIIDPIDGTTNFASGLPLTCVSIGFCVDSKPVLGVVFAPMTDELYMAIRGHGSYRNGVKISKCSSSSSSSSSSGSRLVVGSLEKRLQDAIVCYEFGYARDFDAIDKMTTAVKNILNHGCRSARCLGSGVLDLCYVATGRLDVVYAGIANEGWKPWDYCAANVIVEEAGAIMETLWYQDAGREFNLYSNSILCATSRELLQETRKVVLANF
jgi:inositol-phosphate phosphatase / L-galactose 1-phosphate phosphatase